MIGSTLAAAGGMLAESYDPGQTLLVSVVIFLAVAAAVFIGYRPLMAYIGLREAKYGHALRYGLLLDVSPRMVTFLSLGGMLAMGAIGYLLVGGMLGVLIGMVVGLLLPAAMLSILRRRRQAQLESQLVPGIQTLASGVRAGLNLVQAIERISRDGPSPLRQEFAHLLREYEYGVPLEQAMSNAAERIESGDFHLLFSALHTHRDRGGDLGQTLDRIGESIREIQRLEKRVQTVTAQGRATARWLGVMPAVVLGIYYLIDSAGVRQLFVDGLGNVILACIILLNIIGFLWVKKVVSIDI